MFVSEHRPVLSPTRSTAWHRFFHRLISAAWFDEIKVSGQLPAGGPLLLVSCHRNGAVDGFLLDAVSPRLEFMIAGRLVKRWWQRVFFGGIPVERAKDGERDNRSAMDACVRHLGEGGVLCVFPEGTSSLGPRHLPFHSGAARLAAAYEEENGRLPEIIPIGLHYEEPGLFRSRVEVVIGKPLPIEERGRRIVALKRAIEMGLKEVGANFESELHQDISEAAAMDSDTRYQTLKRWEANTPADLAYLWRHSDPASRELLKRGRFAPSSLLLPLALPGYVLNAPVYMASHLAAKRMADGPNVVALWKILGASTAAAIWVPAMALACGLGGGLRGLASYTASTLLGFALRRPLRQTGRALRWLTAPRRRRDEVRELRTLLETHA